MRNITVVMDVDDVVADLMVAWLEAYNKDYNDFLQVSDITDWRIQDFVKKEAKHSIFKYVKSDEIYYNVKPSIHAVGSVRVMRKYGCRIVFVTNNTFSSPNAKFNWLNRNGFDVSKKDYVEIQDKSLIRGDVIVDDNFDNVISFKGRGLLFSKPWNYKFLYHDRVNDWVDVIYKIKEVQWT